MWWNVLALHGPPSYLIRLNPNPIRLVPPQLLKAVLLIVAGSFLQAVYTQSVLAERPLATQFLSSGLWEACLRALGTRAPVAPDDVPPPPSLVHLGALWAVVSVLAWLIVSSALARARRQQWLAAAADLGIAAWRPCVVVPLVWEAGRLLCFMLGWSTGTLFILGTPVHVHVLSLAWSIAAGYRLFLHDVSGNRDANSMAPRSTATGLGVAWPVWVGMALYTVVFGVLNSQLYFALQLPHGDSAMYEEHLWNVLHGKGFRSYLDQGRLFFGEHIQVIHLLLIPIYVLWPSQLLLEWTQSLCLASGAIPVYWLARRHAGSSAAATALALAYLSYPPLQFLDIAIDFKTFRPNSFEVPLLLFGLEALDRGRWRAALVWAGLMLLCQEDAAPVLAALGVWVAVFPPTATGGVTIPNGNDPPQWRRRWRWGGVLLAVFATVYLALVLKVALPYFRGGADVHYASYFSELGGSTVEILTNLVRRPDLFAAHWLRVENVIFALALLVPVGGLPCLSPSRLAVAVPLWGVLCLNQIARMPVHHFHAPLIPVLFWAAAAGLGKADSVARWLHSRPWRRKRPEDPPPPVRVAARARHTGRTLESTDSTGPVPTPERSSAASATEARPTRLETLGPGQTSFSDRSKAKVATVFALACAVQSCFWTGLGPASLAFWDPYSRGYWRAMYAPGPRAAHFPAVLNEISPTSRVASTDFVHPRFTHFERSYDYSSYRPVVPDDTDYIVIDTAHRYSLIRDASHPAGRPLQPSDIREYREHPDVWELLPDRTQGYFLVFKRRK